MRELRLLSLSLLAVPMLAVAAEPPVRRFDFEAGLPKELRLDGASITNNRRQAIEGTRSVLADFSRSADEWHEFLHTTEALPFEKGKTYAIRFDCEIVGNPDKNVQFYSLMKSRQGKGDLRSDPWLWRYPEGHKGHINQVFAIPEEGGYDFIIGVRHNGAIIIDNLVISEAVPNQATAGIAVKTHSTPVGKLRREFDKLGEEQGLGPLVNDMLVIVVNEGAGDKAVKKKDQIARELQMDFVDWNLMGELASQHGVRSSTGGCEYQEYYRHEGQSDRKRADQIWKNRYRMFDGKGFVVTLENTLVSDETWGEGGYFMCHNGSQWHRQVVESLTGVARKHLAVTQDNIACSVFNRVQGCYCQGCASEFDKVVKTRFSGDDLKKMGIKASDRFSIQDYIVDHGLVGDVALADPVVREYIKFQYKAGLLAWADCVDQIKRVGARQNRPIPCGGNQINVWGTWPYAVTLSQFCDFVEIEELVSVKDEASRRPLQYKVGLASGNHRKPVWVRGPVVDESSPKTPMLSTSYWAIHLAEALANGGIREFSLGVNQPWTNERDTLDYMDDRELYQLFVDFAGWMHAHRALLTQRKSAARVALVYSLPSLVFRRYDALHTGDGGRLGRFEATADLLDRNQIPYDVIILGHPEIFGDADLLGRLKDHPYQLLILPGVDAMTDEQLACLNKQAADRVTVLSDGQVEFDENLNRRQPAASLAADAVSDASIASLGQQATRVRVTAPQTVSVNLWESCGGKSLDVHLLNYDADVAGERLRPVRDIRVRIQLPAGFQLDRCLVSQFGRKDERIPVTRDGFWAEAVVPVLEAYAIVSFTDADAIELTQKAAEVRRQEDREWVRRTANRHGLY